MLTRLYVKDFAIASTVELTLEAGLSVITGETGAGKSLLVDALLLLTGARADAGVVRHGCERAELVAEFDLLGAPAAADWLREQELDDDGACQLRRVVRADGGSRAFINGRPVTLGQLAELGSRLVEIHGQHEHQALLSRTQQLELLDGFGNLHGARRELAQLAREWQAARRELDALNASGDVSERIDYLVQQLAELRREALDPASLEELQQAHRRQANAAGLLSAFAEALGQLGCDGEFGARSHLRRASAVLSRASGDEPRLSEAVGLIDAAAIQLDEAASAIERLQDSLDLDPERLGALEARLSHLHDLARKHRVPLAELAARERALAEELDGLHNAGERQTALRGELERLRRDWQAAADGLSESRRRAADRLGSAVSRLMDELGMAGGRFAVVLEPGDESEPHPLGAERCEFQVSANPGQPLRPLRKVASGGELARISLAIEVAALGADAVPTMVFDEVDSGIGGAVAEVVGQKLRALGMQRQVLCVTHLAQVAAQGRQHYRASKAVIDGHSQSRIDRVAAADRVEEIARMLGGIEITDTTRAHARQLLSD